MQEQKLTKKRNMQKLTDFLEYVQKLHDELLKTYAGYTLNINWSDLLQLN